MAAERDGGGERLEAAGGRPVAVRTAAEAEPEEPSNDASARGGGEGDADMAPAIDLSDDQRFALMKFRRNVQDCRQPHHDDHFLLRWLRAREFDVNAAEKMFRDSLQWRSTWQVESLPNWSAPEPVRDLYPSGLAGFDVDGSPVVVIPFAGLDIWGMLHAVTKSDFIRLTLQKIEYYVGVGEQQAKLHGPQATKVVVIIDMEDFNLRQYVWRPAGETIVALVQMYEANYPEVLKACYIVNAPKVFAIAFSIVKKFMKEYTISKIEIHKNEPEKWKQILLKNIPANQLPAYFGGTMLDPDGDPRCPSKINQGGKIPKSSYFKKTSEKNSNEKFTEAIIKKGEKLQLPYITTEEGTTLRWEFKTDAHDIKFGIVCTDIDGNEDVAVPLHRINCYSTAEIGQISCQAPATYTVTFDNSYSFLRSKTLRYSVETLSPCSEKENDKEHDT